MMKGFGHMAVWVTDMERALHFYVDILGCKKAFSMENNGKPGTEYLALANGAFIELFYNGVPHEQESPGEGRFYAGFSHFAVEVDDIFETVEGIKARGGVLSVALKRGHDGNWQAWIIDPEGIGIEFVQLEPDCKQKQVYFE